MMENNFDQVVFLCMLMRQECERMKIPERVSKQIIKQIIKELGLDEKDADKKQ